jgi:type VI secretion system protein ImpC
MSSRTRFEIGFGATRGDQGVARESQRPLRVMVLGDLSGRSAQSEETSKGLSGRRARTIDVDNFDQVLARIAPSLALRDVRGLDRLALSFGSMDDFHPERLCTSIEACRELRASRLRLTNPSTFADEARRLTTSAHPEPGDVDAVTLEDREALLERIIGVQPRRARAESAQSKVVDRLIRQALGPSDTSTMGLAPEPYLTAIDAALSEWVCAVLHDSAFQSLEGAWRGLRRFVDSVDLGGLVTLQVLDLGKDELTRDLLASAEDTHRSETYRAITDARRDGAEVPPRTLLVGLYRFGATETDLALLERLAELAALLQSPMIVDAEPGLAGCGSLRDCTDPRNWALPGAALEARWHALRRGVSACWLGLALPRVLLRLPYGARGEPIESFSFEEISGDPRHEDFLWGSAALACAQAVAAQALDGHDAVASAEPLEIEDLPAFTRRVEDEPVLQPCAEYLLPTRIGEELSQRGMIPMLSFGNRNAVRVMGVQSVSEPWSLLGGVAAAARGR